MVVDKHNMIRDAYIDVTLFQTDQAADDRLSIAMRDASNPRTTARMHKLKEKEEEVPVGGRFARRSESGS